MVTVALRRTNIGQDAGQPNLLDVLPPERYTILPNTAGCYTAEDAIRTRLRNARREIALAPRYGYFLVNDALEAAVERMATSIGELQAKLPPGEQISAVGICSPGPLNHETGVILDPPKFVHSQRDIKQASRGYKDLNWLALRLLLFWPDRVAMMEVHP